MELSFSDFQIDNALFASGRFDFPVVLCAAVRKPTPPTPVNPSTFISGQHTKLVAQNPPVFSLRVMFYDTDFCPEQIHCNVRPIRAYIEDKYVNVLLDYLEENLPACLVYRSEATVEPITCEPGQVVIPKFVIMQAASFSDPFKLRHVRIEPVCVLLSVHTCMRLVEEEYMIRIY